MMKKYLLVFVAIFLLTAISSAQTIENSLTITANNDYGWAPAGSSSQLVIENILENDILFGQTPNLNTVTVTSWSSPNPYIEIGTDGSVILTQSSTPEGDYSISYRITEIGNPFNYAIGTVTVTVGGCRAPPAISIEPGQCGSSITAITWSGFQTSPATIVYSINGSPNQTATGSNSITLSVSGAGPINVTYNLAGDCPSLPTSVLSPGVDCEVHFNFNPTYTDLNSDGIISPGDLVNYN